MQHDSSLGRCSAGFAAMALVMSLSAVAYAAIPSVTQIEGALASTGGGPVSDGAYAMTFLLYKDAQGGAAVWTEGPIDVAVVSGSFSHDLGATTPLTQDVLKALAGQGFLALKVGQDPELTRKPLRAASFALRTAVAEGLDCSGCLTADQLDAGVLQPYAKTASLATVATTGKFSDLQGGPDLSAYAKLASLADVASTGAYADLIGAPDTSVFAKAADLAQVATSGKYTDLTDTPALAKLGATCGTGLVIKGLKADGSYECVQSMDPAGLPADGIDELSNGLIWNQFTDVFSSSAALPIPDNNPIGGFSEIVVGDVGLAQKLTVSIEVANSDVTNLQISLFDAANQQYVLWNKGGKKGDGIKTAYPDPTKTISGDLTYWAGKNPKGTWYLQVIDVKFLNNTTDGQLTAWSINVQTLSDKKVQIKGDLFVGGSLAIGKGSIFPAGSVLPFNLASCPTGWLPADGGSGTIDMRGRIPLVTGNLPYGGTVALNAAGGSHMWRIYAAGGYGGNRCGGSSEMGSWGIGWQAESDVTMGMNNNWVGYTNHLPPYTGVLFCQKQ